MNIEVTFRKFGSIENLHIFVLAGFAVAQPIYDILGQYPEFFIAHRAGPLMILGVVLFLSFALPCGLCLIKLAVRPFGDSAHRALHLILVCILAVLAFMPVAGRFILRGDILFLAVTLIAGLTFTVLYVRLQSVRTLVTVLLPAVVIFPLWFLGMTPVARLVLPQTVEGLTEVKIENPAPVVLIVLDEFNPTALLGQNGRIDPVRFPNFAKLAEQSFWFPNAVGPHAQTMHALPAILTGRQPRPELRLNPTASDHPENLFTLLGGRFQVNALETQTELCPKSICREDRDPVNVRNPHIFWTDLGILYLHIIVPSKWKQSLPTLEGQWTGFADGYKADIGSQSKNMRRRAHQFERFISEMDNNTNNQFHFLHILLPHLPYKYLSTGHVYNQSVNHALPEGIKNEISGWSYSEPLVTVAYHQYLQQVGFVDLLLGKLFEKLRENEIFDKSLIILTADHGISFQAGQNRRGFSDETIRDIFKVPMFVKLPGQYYGEIEEKLVSGIDILATIADILEIELPYEVDGHSMISNSVPARAAIEIAGTLRFEARKFEGFPELQWQIRHFGCGTPLKYLGIGGPYPHLMGQQVSGLDVREQKDLQCKSDIMIHFEQVDPDTDFLPALFSGNITGTDELDLPLAIAINDHITTTTTTSQWLRIDRYFATLFPAGVFKPGRNSVDVLLIQESSDGLNLLRIPFVHEKINDFEIRYQPDGRLVLVLDKHVEIPVDSDQNLIKGYVDSMIHQGNILHIQGWAGDHQYQPVQSVLVFSGDRLVAETKPKFNRQDVAQHFKQESMLRSGFRVQIPFSPRYTDIGDLRVIGVSKGKDAVELGFSTNMQ